MNRRNLIAFAALIGLGLALIPAIGRLLTNPSAFPPHDFVEYWSAAYLHTHGENPYDAVRMYELERDHIGWDPVGQAIMMWNPPWTLSFVMPLGWMPWKVAQLVWLVARLAALVLSAVLLGQVYDRKKPLAAIVIFTWIPCYIALQYGQIPPLMLLGVSLFLDLNKRNEPFLAGMSCVLLAVKPHLAIFFWLAVARQAIIEKQWRIIAGGILGGVLASLIPVIMNPQVFSQYLEASRSTPPVQWITPTIGSWLRYLSGTASFGPQWLPLVAGLVWFVWDSWNRRGHVTKWSDQLPMLLLVSLVCAPYGCWPYDLSLLVIPFIAHANRQCRRQEIIVYSLISLGILIMVSTEVEAHWLVWVSPVVMIVIWILVNLRNTSTIRNERRTGSVNCRVESEKKEPID